MKVIQPGETVFPYTGKAENRGQGSLGSESSAKIVQNWNKKVEDNFNLQCPERAVDG
jgi:hypothetical protein